MFKQALLAAALFASMVGTVDAQSGTQPVAYPTKPVRFIVPFPAGGAADTIARIVTQQFSINTKQAVVIENKPGADTIIGMQAIKAASPDGYTVGYVIGSALTMNPLIFEKLPYAVSDFDPVMVMADLATGLAVHPSVPAQDVRQLTKLISSKPDELFFAHANVLSEIAAEAFAKAAGGKMTAVAYKGSGPSTQALLTGEVQVLIAPADGMVPYVKEGKMRMLALTNARKSAAFPGVPTVAEAGLPGFVFENWHAIVVPANTPPNIVAALHAQLVKAARAPEVVARLAQVGSEVVAGTPDELRRRIATESAHWKKELSAIGFTKR